MRRFLALASLTVTLAVAAPLRAQQNDAEKLFRAMEEKIMTAKSLRVAAMAVQKFGDEAVNYKGHGLMMQGNKARFELEFEIYGTTIKKRRVSNGSQMIVDEPGAGPDARPTPVNMNKILSGALASCGIVMATELACSSGDLARFELDKNVPVSNFKMGVKEKVGNAEAQVIEYIVKFGGERDAPVKLWIDTKTNLPLKRVMEYQGSWTETYSELVLDAKVDSKEFDLPK